MDTHEMHTDGQANIPKSDVTGSSAAPMDEAIDLDALRAEVVKWQERVPKLAKALRERTEELAETREELRAAQSSSSVPAQEDVEVSDARLQARNQLIAELQEKVADLGEKHRKSASELHAMQLELEHAQEEATGWQAKWREVTASLDDSVADATRSSSELSRAKQDWQGTEQALKQEHEAALERVNREAESLRVRNANLGETIEFANKQIETLGEDMALLVERGNTADDALAAAEQKNAELEQSKVELEQRLAAVDNQLADRQGAIDDAQAALQTAQAEIRTNADQIADLTGQLESSRLEHEQALKDQANSLEQQLHELQSKLEQEDRRYTTAMQAAEEEQSQLTHQLDAKDEVIAGVNSQLSEHEAQKAKLDEELRQRQRLVEDAQAQIEEGIRLAEEKQNQIKALQETQGALNTQLENAQQQLQETTNTAAADRQTASAKIEELQQALQSATQTAADAQTQAQSDAHNAVEQIEALQAALEAAQAELSSNAADREVQQTELDALRTEQARWSENEHSLLQQVNALTAESEQQHETLQAEITRLQECVEQAQDSNEQRESERRDLADQVLDLSDENKKLKANLEERSALVRELEAERSNREQALNATDAEQARLSQALSEAQHKMATFQEHAQTLEGKLVTQQGLMSELETELSETQEQYAVALKAAEQEQRGVVEERSKMAEQLTQAQHRCYDLEASNARLEEKTQSQVASIDALTSEVERERQARKDQQSAVASLQAELETIGETHRQEITVLKAQREQSEAPTAAAPGSEENVERLRELEQLLRERTEELDKLRWRVEQQPPSADENVVMILNQQLNDAHEENKRLRDKLSNSKPDDLTVLKGVGDKLAKQLAELGITQLAQIAELDEASLDDEAHVLHSFKSRILRDDWIKQAQATLDAREI